MPCVKPETRQPLQPSDAIVFSGPGKEISPNGINLLILFGFQRKFKK
jgi:hypothetical protein